MSKNRRSWHFIFAWVFLSIIVPGRSGAQQALTAKQLVRNVADAVLKGSTFRFVDKSTGKTYSSPTGSPSDATLTIESPYNDWRYWNGVLNIAMLTAGEALHDTAYSGFSARNISFSFDNYGYFEKKKKGEGKWAYPFGQRIVMEELDDCGAMGASLIDIYRTDPQRRYREYIDRAAEFISSGQSRMDDGTLVRPFPHKWTIWADDLYMSVSFLSRMGELTGDRRYFDDAAKQVVKFHRYLFDASKGLMVHYWYSDVDRKGVAFWGRANGWAVMAQINLLDRLPKDHPMRDTLLALLQRHLLGIARVQCAGGLWHQLLDKEDSYLETSCSAMFTYAFARAVTKGYLDGGYASIARAGWEGVASKIQSSGEVEGVCEGTGVSDDLVYYYHRPTPNNDPHGVGVVILAGVEVLQLPK